MKIIYIFIIMLILNSSCATSKKNSDSFVGFIEYDISIIYKNPAFKKKYGLYIDQKYGNRAITYFGSDGSLMKKHPESGDLGMEFISYLTTLNMSYARWRNIDTIYSHDASINSLTLIDKKLDRGEKIMNYDCESILYIGTDNNSSDTIRLEYFYSQELFLDPEPYNKQKDFFANEIFAKMRAPPLRLNIDYSSYIIDYVAIRIERKLIGKDIFKLNPDLPIKEY